MRTNPLFGPVSLSLGLHAALFALVLGRSGPGGEIVHPSLSVGPIVVEIVSFETGRPGTAVDSSSVARGTAAKVKKTPAAPVRKPGTSLRVKVPVPPPAHPSRKETAKSTDPVEAPLVRAAEGSGHAGATGAAVLREGSTRSRTPLLAYAAAPPAPALSGGFTNNNGPGLGFVRAEAIDLPEPVYPAWCRRRGQEGKVILSVSVGRDGRPGAVSIVRSSGFSMLDRAAVKALRKATFSPASSAGILVPSTRKIAYSFRITDGRN